MAASYTTTDGAFFAQVDAERVARDAAAASYEREQGYPLSPKHRNPPPKWGDEAVVPLAIDYLKQKARAGEQKYGMPLQTYNGRSALLDAMEEARDLFLYLYQACREGGLV